MAARSKAAIERAERAVAERKARDERDEQRRTRVLQLRMAGVQYPDIARETGSPDAVADARQILAERARSLEAAEHADALEIERLDTLTRHAQQILAVAAQPARDGRARDPALALRAIDRLLLISERRSMVLPARAEPGPMERAVIAQVAEYPEDLRAMPEAVAAILLARRMDANLPAVDVTGIARELRVTLIMLAAKAPVKMEGSVRDELYERRAKRLAEDLALADSD